MTARRAAIVIPARYGSTRFPGKPLACQTGKFLIQHVVEQAARCARASDILVATDDQRIADAVASFGGRAVMTSPAHHSGTDRIAEVVRHPEFADVELIVNVQGDEPEIEPALIDDLIDAVSRPDVPISTAAAPFEHAADIENPNMVKVARDQNHFAMYFSRAVIPFERDPGPGPSCVEAYRKHLGIYAYQRGALLKLSAAPVCELERIEKLEQLRALYLGLRIFVQDTPHAPHGIDTPEDYAAFVKRYNEHTT